MKTSELLHFAFRARDPLTLGRWYAELFEGQFFLHPVMSALGIVIVKINHPEAVFDGLLEFWPWDLEWDGQAAVFRKIEPRPSLLHTVFPYTNAIHHPPALLLNVGRVEATGGDYHHYYDGITPAVGRLIDALDSERLAVAAALAFCPLALQHARIFAGGVDLEIQAPARNVGEGGLGLLHLEELVGIAIVVADEFTRERVGLRRRAEQGTKA